MTILKPAFGRAATWGAAQNAASKVIAIPWRHRAAIALLLAFSTSVYADGATTIHGVNSSGEQIALDEEWLPVPGASNLDWTGFYVVSVGVPGERPKEEFGAQHCGVRIASFSCARGGQSPLAGA